MKQRTYIHGDVGKFLVLLTLMSKRFKQKWHHACVQMLNMMLARRDYCLIALGIVYDNNEPRWLLSKSRHLEKPT